MVSNAIPNFYEHLTSPQLSYGVLDFCPKDGFRLAECQETLVIEVYFVKAFSNNFSVIPHFES